MSNLIQVSPGKLALSQDIQIALNAALQTPKNEKQYLAQINSKNPTAFIFLIDQSGSMKNTINWNGEMYSKADVATKIINELIDELVNLCANSPCEHKERYSISVIGYGGNSGDIANYCWQDNLSTKTWVTVNDLANNRTVDFNTLSKAIIIGIVAF
jgi:hypothetical protein